MSRILRKPLRADLFEEPPAWAGPLARLALVVALLLAAIGLLSPITYQIDQGTVTFRPRPLLPWEQGRVVLPLGPAGTVSLKTHRTPIELVADFRLEGRIPSVSEARVLLASRPAVQGQAEAAFDRFMRAKLPWALAVGGLSGVLVGGISSRRPRRTLAGATFGSVGALLLAGILGAATLATLDRTPAVQYEGLVANAPEVLQTIRSVAQESEDGWRSAEDFVRGLNRVTGQMQTAAGRQRPAGVVRVLVASDLHDNLIGMALTSSLARSRENPVSAVVLAGDMTQRGSEPEGMLLAERLNTGEVPVLIIGGNHEDTPAMRVFDEAGHLMLGGRTTRVAGLLFRGEDDPLAWSMRTTPDPERLRVAGIELRERLQKGSRLPDMLVLHDFQQARAAVEWAKENEVNLTVVYGHDHIAAVSQEGTVNLIDGGTAGASGLIGLGRDPDQLYTFQLLDFALEPEPQLVSVTTLKYAGLRGQAIAEYYPIGE